MTTDPGGGRPRPPAGPAAGPPAGPAAGPARGASGAAPPLGPPPPRTREWKAAPPLVGAVVLVVLAWSVWARTGSRVALFAGAATAVAAVGDLLWSRFLAARVVATVVANPVEARVGDAVHVTVRFDGPRQRARASLAAVAPEPLDVEVPSTVTFDGVAPGRQVATAVVVEVTSSGVAGLAGVLHRRTVPLLRALFVGPRPLPAAEAFPDLVRTWGEGEPRPAPTGDLVRGVRPYVPGDPPRRVHWRAAARVGDLVVKEVEDVDAPRILLAVDLGAGGAAGERAAGRAAWYAEEGMRRGYAVLLATAELARDGDRTRNLPVTGPVRSPGDVTRRLAAAAGPGKPALPPATEAGSVLLVTDRGDTWR